MPYAAKGKIAFEEAAFDEFEAFIEITEAQYMDALEGMQNGLEVTIDDGFKVALPPPPAPPPPPTEQEFAAAALSQRDLALSIAAIRIAPLQDAVDLGDENPGDVAALKQWKQYRVGLNRIEQQVGFPLAIDWPVMPG